MVYKTQNKKQKKRRRGLGVVVALLIILVLLWGVIAFFFFGGTNLLPLMGKPATPYVAEGQVQALTLAPTGGDLSEEGLRAYYEEALAFAGENNINTIIFEGKSGLPVYWRDSIFPAADEITAQDTFLHKLDPLKLLCEAAEGKNIQMWVQVDAYSTAGYHSEMDGKVAKLLEGGAASARFAADNQTYLDLLEESLTRLRHNYPLAGIVLAGLDAAEGQQIDAATWNTAFGGLVSQLHTAFGKEGYATQLSLRFDGEGGSLLSAETAASLSGSGSVAYLMPRLASGLTLTQNIQKWSAGGDNLVFDVPAENADVVLFTAATTPAYKGALFGGWPALKGEGAYVGLLQSTLTVPTEGTLPTGYDVPQTLAVTYPGDTVSNGFATVYVLGTSDPSQPLYLDGVEVGSEQADGSTFGVRGAMGTFGVPVELEVGENTFTFTQGDVTYTKTVTRKEYVAPTPGTPVTRLVPEAGQAMRISTAANRSAMASALTDPGVYDSINETLYDGAVFVAQEGSTGNAYKMPSGDWVMYSNCEWIDGDGRSSFTGLVAEPNELGEYIRFTGSGTPAAYLAYENNGLTITMYDTSFTLDGGFSSQYVKSASVTTGEDGATVLRLELNEIWGYQIEYAEGQTSIFLKKMPQLSGSASRPLEGITVLLDPGHGGDIAEPGTGGVLWHTGEPNEEQVNLRLAQTIAYRLRQLGATVTLTRTENVDVTPGERVEMERQQKPDFFLSVHHNAVDLNGDRSGATYMQSYYFHPYAVPPTKDYAQNLIENIGRATGRAGSEAQWGYFLVTRVTICPSVLFEYAFLINPLNFEDAVSTEGLYAAAVGTADGILATLRQALGGAETQPPPESPDGSQPLDASAPSGTEAVCATPPSFAQNPALKRRRAV